MKHYFKVSSDTEILLITTPWTLAKIKKSFKEDNLFPNIEEISFSKFVKIIKDSESTLTTI